MIMKTGCFGILLALASVLPSWAQLEVPPRFNYQGVLRDGTGGVLGEQTPTIHFKLYKESSGGSAVWTGDQKVLLDTNGLFNVTLADQMAGSMGDDVTLGGVIASNATLFMGIAVDENPEISPRQELLSVPFALRAGDVNQASSGFTVNGLLAAKDGANIVGELQTTKIQMGSNTLSVAGGAADLNLAGSLDISDGLHVMQNARVDGTTTLKGNTTVSNLTGNGNTTVADLTVNGPTTMSGLTVKGNTIVSNLTVGGRVQIGATNSLAASGEEALRIVRGVVNENGTPGQGHGFTSAKSGLLYVITFTTAFSDVPTVVATCYSPDEHGRVATVSEYSHNSVSLHVRVSDSGEKDSAAFHFIAAGPR